MNGLFGLRFFVRDPEKIKTEIAVLLSAGLRHFSMRRAFPGGNAAFAVQRVRESVGVAAFQAVGRTFRSRASIVRTESRSPRTEAGS